MCARHILELCGESGIEEEVCEVNALERAILLELNWEVQCVTCVSGVYALLECVSPLLVEAKESVMDRCNALCWRLVLDEEYYKYELKDICVSVLELESGLCVGERVELSCRAWVNEKACK